MPSIDQTVRDICAAPSLSARIAEIRKIPGRHGTDDWQEVYAAIARELYVPALTPDFAYIHTEDFYSAEHFRTAYEAAERGTATFTATDRDTLARTLRNHPTSLLAFRVITGLTRDEFAHATSLITEGRGVPVDAHERKGAPMSAARAQVFAATIGALLAGSLFAPSRVDDVVSKQALKADTAAGWVSVARCAEQGVPYWMLLHQRHYGGAFRQLLDATSTRRGNLIEDEVEELFAAHQISYLRTGSHRQGDIMERFGLQLGPAPDFVVFDETSDTLLAILECKGANDGGTARDKALRFERLHAEAQRLGGIPLIAVLGGIGWRRVNDTLGPVLRETEGRVFTLATLPEMLTIPPFATMAGAVPGGAGGPEAREREENDR